MDRVQQNNAKTKQATVNHSKSRSAFAGIWWNWKGTMHYESLLPNEKLYSNTYCSQCDRLKVAMDTKRPEFVNRKLAVFYRMDNARPHVSLQSWKKFVQLGWDVLFISCYSADFPPSDYHLFRCQTLEACEKHLEQFIAHTDGNRLWKRMSHMWLSKTMYRSTAFECHLIYAKNLRYNPIHMDYNFIMNNAFGVIAERKLEQGRIIVHKIRKTSLNTGKYICCRGLSVRAE